MVHAAEALETVRDMGPESSTTTPELWLGAHRWMPGCATVHGPADGEPGRYLAAVGPYVGLVSISYAQRRCLRAAVVRTVYNGLDLARFPLCTDRGDHALFLGRMSPDKGAQVAIDVARRRDAGSGSRASAPSRPRSSTSRQSRAAARPWTSSGSGELGNGDKQAALCAGRLPAVPLAVGRAVRARRRRGTRLRDAGALPRARCDPRADGRRRHGLRPRAAGGPRPAVRRAWRRSTRRRAGNTLRTGSRSSTPCSGTSRCTATPSSQHEPRDQRVVRVDREPCSPVR